MDTQYLAKIRWKARRGMKEIDVLLERFIENNLNQLTVKDQLLFESILDEEDDMLWKWLSNQQQPSDLQKTRIINIIRQ